MPNKRLALPVAFLCVTQAAAAAISMSGLKTCTKMSDDHERLACFDHVMSAANAAASPGDTGSVISAPKLSAEQKLGLPQEKIDRLESRNDPTPPAPPITKLQAHVSAITMNSANRKVFTLDNSQVWQQIEADTAFVTHEGDAVEISKGAFGSFFLSAGKHASTRVTRVR